MPIDIDGLSMEELIQLDHRVVERIKMLRPMQAHVDMMAFNLGARVSFDSQEGHQLGTLVKYNRRTVTVLTDDGRQCGACHRAFWPPSKTLTNHPLLTTHRSNQKQDCAESVGVNSGTLRTLT